MNDPYSGAYDFASLFQCTYDTLTRHNINSPIPWYHCTYYNARNALTV